MPDESENPRLFLIAPSAIDAESFPALLADVLGAADFAAVLVDAGEAIAAALVPVVQMAGAAAIVVDDTRIAGRLKADGVHVGTGLGDLRNAVQSFQGKKIVGAANIRSRHTAMEAGEVGADYVFFGRRDGDTHPEPHPKALDLAEWWSELTDIPAVVMAGSAVESVAAASATGSAFIGLHHAIWSHPAGPVAAAQSAADILARGSRQPA